MIKGSSHAPATRWVIPPPWSSSPVPPETIEAPPTDAPVPARRTAKRDRPSTTAAVLLELLQRDLRFGYRWVALRHFLMVRACGVQLPADLREQCERLLLECPVSSQERVARSVEWWICMTNAAASSSSRGGGFAPGSALPEAGPNIRP
jgi:hypothetical protein